jgi:hypothetical protein
VKAPRIEPLRARGARNAYWVPRAGRGGRRAELLAPIGDERSAHNTAGSARVDMP